MDSFTRILLLSLSFLFSLLFFVCVNPEFNIDVNKVFSLYCYFYSINQYK